MPCRLIPKTYIVSMRVFGIGTDIVECSRVGKMIEQHGEVFLERVFTRREIQYCGGHKKQVERYAGRWAAKEAILKCLGTGWRRGISWLDVEVHNETSGKPVVLLGGPLRDLAVANRIQEVLITISHCQSYATAYALAMMDQGETATTAG